MGVGFRVWRSSEVAEALHEKLRAEQTVYIFVNGIALKTGTPMSELYGKLAPKGGFLYIRYGAENTLGQVQLP